MLRNIRRGTAAVGIAAIALLVAACGSENTTSGGDSPATTTETMTPEETSDNGASNAVADLVGPGCAGYAEQVPDGPGSVEGMTADPVAVAAGNNPLLGTLVSAVSGQLNPDVDLVDTLNGGEFTVFAPVDAAFAKIEPATIETLKTDADLLTEILTYHVVAGQITPDGISGEHETVQGGTVTVTGSGDNLKVDDANVICGGVKTANATVYLVDSVLMPG